MAISFIFSGTFIIDGWAQPSRAKNRSSANLSQPPRAASQQSRDWFYTALQINYVALNAADLITTFYSLEKGAHEANPIARLFIQNKPLTVVIKVGVIGGVLWGLSIVKKEDKKAAYITLGLLNVVYGYVVQNNIGVMLQLNK